MKRIIHWIGCHIFGTHTWTSPSLRGELWRIPPDATKAEIQKIFNAQASLHCKHCGKPSKQNELLYEEP